MTIRGIAKLLFGFIFMLLGIVGVTREAADFTKHRLPIVALAAAFCFVSGLMIVVKKDTFSDEGSGSVPQDPLPEQSDTMKDG